MKRNDIDRTLRDAGLKFAEMADYGGSSAPIPEGLRLKFYLRAMFGGKMAVSPAKNGSEITVELRHQPMAVGLIEVRHEQDAAGQPRITVNRMAIDPDEIVAISWEERL